VCAGSGGGSAAVREATATAAAPHDLKNLPKFGFL
jgi:hypothetical protein